MNLNEKKANRIATIPGVDALYYQLNVTFDDYINFYTNCSLSNIFTFGNFNRLSQDWNKQYTYFELLGIEGTPIAKIGFKNLNLKDNLEPIIVQMSSYYMNIHGIEESCLQVKKEIELLGLKVNFSKIQRLDLNTYVYGHDFSYLSYYYFSTLIRSNSKYYSGAKDKLTTFYLGKRSVGSSPFMRIYDKWQELKDMDKDVKRQSLIRYKFKKELGIDLDESVPLWNVEFELKREFLKQNGVNTVEDFFRSANTLHNIVMERIRLLRRKRVDGDKNTNRIQTASVWNKIQKDYNFMDSNVPLDKIIPIRYSKDIKWLENRLEEYLKEKTDNITDNELMLRLSNKLNHFRQDERENK